MDGEAVVFDDYCSGVAGEAVAAGVDDGEAVSLPDSGAVGVTEEGGVA